MPMKRIAVFCGANFGAQAAYQDVARELGRQLVKRGIGLVYGGGKVGLMGAIADEVCTAGGDVIGVIPDDLFKKEVGKTELKDLRVVRSMHERKSLMAELSDGFIALPGGYGTFEEIFEIVTWAQLGFHRKPCGLVNVNGYYDQLIAFLDHSVKEDFVFAGNRSLLLDAPTPEGILRKFDTYVPQHTARWLKSSADL